MKSRLTFDSWLARMHTPPVATDAITYLLDGCTAETRAAFAVEEDHSFTVMTALLRGLAR